MLKPPWHNESPLLEQLAPREITDAEGQQRNLAENAIPGLVDGTEGTHPEFLAERRKLIAKAIRRHYEAL